MYKKKEKGKNKTDVRSALGRNGLAGFYFSHLPFLSMTCVTHLALFLFLPGVHPPTHLPLFHLCIVPHDR
jgi:hypothetical protein